MNIFKILAQGDGTINEPNVSAFLGYLLDPNEDHGLGSKLLESMLKLHYECEYEYKVEDKECFIDNKPNLKWLVNNEADEKIIDLSKNGDYEVKVFFEQAFAGNNGKQIVDIMLIIHEMPKGEKKEQYFKSYIQNEKKLKHVFLIEVKITDSAAHPTDFKKNKEGQLLQQVKNSQNVLEELLKINKVNFDKNKDISIIFVTPDILDKSNKINSKSKKETNAKTAFEEVCNDDKLEKTPKSLIFWNTIRDIDGKIINEESIEKLIDNIIYSTHEDKSEPIPEYTIDTLKSFSNFIYSDFSYRYKRLPSFEKDVKENFEEFYKEYEYLFDNEIWSSLQKIRNSITLIENQNLRVQHSKTHPLSYLYNGTKVFSISSYGRKLKLHFITKRNYMYNIDEELKILFPTENGYVIRDTSTGPDIHNITNSSIDNIIELTKLVLYKIKQQNA